MSHFYNAWKKWPPLSESIMVCWQSKSHIWKYHVLFAYWFQSLCSKFLSVGQSQRVLQWSNQSQLIVQHSLTECVTLLLSIDVIRYASSTTEKNRRWTNVGLQLGQRRRRWRNSKAILVQRVCWELYCIRLAVGDWLRRKQETTEDIVDYITRNVRMGELLVYEV